MSSNSENERYLKRGDVRFLKRGPNGTRIGPAHGISRRSRAIIVPFLGQQQSAERKRNSFVVVVGSSLLRFRPLGLPPGGKESKTPGNGEEDSKTNQYQYI